MLIVDTAIPSVRPSVTLSHAYFVSKRLNVSSKFFHYVIGASFQLFVTKGCCVNLTASPLTGALYTGGVAIFDQYARLCGCISERVIDKVILLWKMNIKLYRIVIQVPLSMTSSGPEPHF